MEKFYRRIGLLVGLLTCSGVSLAQNVYVAGANSSFGILNLQTGAYSLVSTLTTEIGGLGYGSNGALYGLGVDGNVYTLNGSGNESLVGASGLNLSEGWGLGASNDGTVYAQAFGGNEYTISQTTGQGTEFGSLGFNTGAVYVGDNAGNLYISNNVTNQLYSVNRSTGAPTLIGTMNGVASVDGLVFDNGAAYAISELGGIYQINLTNASATEIATYNTSQDGAIFAGASVYATPEPGTMLALSGVSLLLMRRRARKS